MLRANPKVIENSIVDHSGCKMESSLVVKDSSCIGSIVFGFDGRFTTILLLIFYGLLEDYLILARYVVQFEHEFFGECEISFALFVNAVIGFAWHRSELLAKLLE